MKGGKEGRKKGKGEGEKKEREKKQGSNPRPSTLQPTAYTYRLR